MMAVISARPSHQPRPVQVVAVQHGNDWHRRLLTVGDILKCSQPYLSGPPRRYQKAHEQRHTAGVPANNTNIASTKPQFRMFGDTITKSTTPKLTLAGSQPAVRTQAAVAPPVPRHKQQIKAWKSLDNLLVAQRAADERYRRMHESNIQNFANETRVYRKQPSTNDLLMPEKRGVHNNQHRDKQPIQQPPLHQRSKNAMADQFWKERARRASCFVPDNKWMNHF